MYSLNQLVEGLFAKTWKTSLVWMCLLSMEVMAYYCDHNYCQINSQYCCGDNLCCDYVNQTLFNSIIIIIAIITISSILWAIFRIFFFSDVILVIKKFGQRFIKRQATASRDSKWFEDTESSLLTDHLDLNRG